MNVFVIRHIINNDNLGAYASNSSMEDFLFRWKKIVSPSRMTISQTMEFIEFLDKQEDTIKINEIDVFSFGYLNVWKDD